MKGIRAFVFAALYAAAMLWARPGMSVMYLPGDVIVGDVTGFAYKIHPGPGAVPEQIPGTVSASDLESDGMNVLLVQDGPGYVLKLNTATEAVTSVVTDEPVAHIGIDRAIRRLYALAALVADEIRIYDLDTFAYEGSVTVTSAFLNDIAVDTNHDLLLSYGDSVYRVSMPVTLPGVAGTPQLIGPVAGAGQIVVGGGSIFVTEASSGCIVKFPGASCVGSENDFAFPSALGINDSGLLFTVHSPMDGVQLATQDQGTHVVTPASSTGILGGVNFLAVLSGNTCGNGSLDGGEQCDGSVAGPNAACCRSDCTFHPVGTSCSDGDVCNGAETCDAGVCFGGEELECDDGNECTFDGCDNGLGGCVNDVLEPGGLPCDQGNLCEPGKTCNLGACQGGTSVNCSDSSSCTDDMCVPATGLCEHVPVVTTDLIEGEKYSLRVGDKDVGDSNDLIVGNLSKGDNLIHGTSPGQSGDPVLNGTNYQVCVLDEMGPDDFRVIFDSMVMSGGTCKGKPCWKYSGKPGHESGLLYRDPKGENGIVSKLAIKWGSSSKLMFGAKGNDFPNLVPMGPGLLAENGRVSVIVKGSHGTSWRFDLTTPAKMNDPVKRKFADSSS